MGGWNSGAVYHCQNWKKFVKTVILLAGPCDPTSSAGFHLLTGHIKWAQLLMLGRWLEFSLVSSPKGVILFNDQANDKEVISIIVFLWVSGDETTESNHLIDAAWSM